MDQIFVWESEVLYYSFISNMPALASSLILWTVQHPDLDQSASTQQSEDSTYHGLFKWWAIFMYETCFVSARNKMIYIEAFS